MVTGFVVAWTAIIGSVAVRFRRPRRLIDLVAQGSPPASAQRWPERLGRWLLPRRRPWPAFRCEQLGLAVPAVVAGAAVWFPLAPVFGFGAWAWPLRRHRRTAQARRRAVVRDLPDVIDLFGLAFAAGLNVRLAIEAVAGSADGVVAEPLVDVVAEVGRGQRLHVALTTMVTALGDPVRPLFRVLADPDSSPAQRAAQLDVVAVDARLERRRAAEIDARRVPVRLLFPLVVAILPAFGLLTVVPIVAGSLGSVTG